jgi:hypothetical protein
MFSCLRQSALRLAVVVSSVRKAHSDHQVFTHLDAESRTLRIAIVFILAFAASCLRAEAQEPSWLYPSAGALLSSAKKGYDGAKAKRIRQDTRCVWADCVSEVEITPPLQAAHALGAERRRKFDPVPTEKEVLELQGQLAIGIVLNTGVLNQDLDAEAAIVQGEKLTKPSEKQVLLRVLSECSIPFAKISCWQIVIAYRFNYPSNGGMPAGKASLLIRRSDGKEQKVDLDFDKIARASAADAAH